MWTWIFVVYFQNLFNLLQVCLSALFRGERRGRAALSGTALQHGELSARDVRKGEGAGEEVQQGSADLRQPGQSSFLIVIINSISFYCSQ